MKRRFKHLLKLRFKNVRVAAKLWTAAAALVLALVVLVGVAALRTARLQAEAEAALVQGEAKVRIALSWAAVAETSVRFQAAMIGQDAAVDVAFKGAIEETDNKLEAQRNLLEAMALNPRERELFEQINDKHTALMAVAIGIRSQRERGNGAEAAAQTDAVFRPAAVQYLLTLNEFVTAQEKLAVAARAEFGERRKTTLRIVQGMLALIVLGILAGTAVLVRTIRNPLDDAVGVARRVAAGELDAVAVSDRADEFGDLMRALEETVRQLSAMVGRIKHTSDTVNTAAREIAQSHSDLSSRTEEQASALEETSASMQQMTATVSQNAQNAKTADQLAAQASAVAEKGGAVVKEAVGTMSGITAASKRIADIIGVIDGIAFQTNILALNAAVEAARAGEQGRGFAVVASEVRSLAQRSALAAKEIRDLIAESVSKVDAGARQVNDAGRTMEEVVAAVKKVTGLIAEITAASQEQAQGIEQVSHTMRQLEKVTQQNAAMVEEASAAAGSLDDQAKALAGAVAVFRLHAEALKPEAKQPAIEAKKLVEVRKPVAAKKGNGHLEEAWQEF
jgi:methyl-accepting chemotaxis protein